MAEQRDDWDQHWSHYAEAAGQNPAQSYRRHLIARLLTSSGEPARIVDIGSGSGDLAYDLSQDLPRVELLGLELSQHGVDMAAARVPSATFLQEDLLTPGDPQPQYRGWATHAVCSEVLEHVDDPIALLEGSKAYLEPGCRVIVTVPGGPKSAFDHHIGHRRHYSRDSLRRTLEGAGFEVDVVLAAGFPFFNLYRLVVIARGKRLVEEVSSENRDTSRLAQVVMQIFGLLFRLNTSRTPWGWQIAAVARVPDRP